MEKQEFSKEILKSIRDTLPQGAQTKIAQKLNTPDCPVSVEDVNKVLHGKGLRYRKIDPAVIIKEAADICKAVKASRVEAKQAVEELFDSTEKQ